MGATIPKQYLHKHGEPVLTHTIGRFVRHPLIHGVVVMLSAGDTHFPTLRLPDD